MKIKRHKVLIALVLAVCLLATSAVAAVPEDTGVAQPYYTGISTFGTGFDINDGVAECSSSVLVSSMNNTGKLFMSLQRSVDGVNWSGYKTWTATGSGRIALTETYSVTSGYYYRIHCNANVYDADGNILGLNVKNSDMIYY